MKVSSLFFLLVFLTGCASGSLLVDTSPPKAEVFVKAMNAQEYKSLGPAPITKPISEIRSLVGGESTIVLETRLPGHFDKSMLIADLNAAADFKVTLALQNIETFVQKEKDGGVPLTDEQRQSKEALEKAKELSELNIVIDKLFEVQRLARVGRVDDAIKSLDEIEKTHPSLAVVHELRGGVAFMRKDLNSALDAYAKAVRLNPYNLESVNMKKYLEKVLKVDRVPSAAPEGGAQ